MKKQIKKVKIFFLPSKENNYRAPFLGSRFLLAVILILFLMKVGFFFFLWQFPKLNLFAEVSRSVLVSLTNQTRQSSGIYTLKENSKLNQAAYLKARDMLDYDYFAHTSPAGKSPWYFLEAAGYNYQYAGENLAIDFFDSGEVFQAWLNSPGHRANIVNSKFQEIGMSVLMGNFQGRQTTVVVQFFATPMSVPAAVAKEPQVQAPSSQSQPKTKITTQPSQVPSAPMTLYEYYRRKGQAMPSIQERAVLYESFGLGSASSYQGLLWQNSLLVNKLLEQDKKKESASSEPVKEEPAEVLPPKEKAPEPTSEPEATPAFTEALIEDQDQDDLTEKETDPIFPAGEIKIPPPKSTALGYRVLSFVVQNYDMITRNIFIIVFSFVFLSVCVDIAAKSNFRNADLVLRGTIYCIVLLGLFLMDKEVILRLIPNSFSI